MVSDKKKTIYNLGRSSSRDERVYVCLYFENSACSARIAIEIV